MVGSVLAEIMLLLVTHETVVACIYFSSSSLIR